MEYTGTAYVQTIYKNSWHVKTNASFCFSHFVQMRAVRTQRLSDASSTIILIWDMKEKFELCIIPRKL